MTPAGGEKKGGAKTPHSAESNVHFLEIFQECMRDLVADLGGQQARFARKTLYVRIAKRMNEERGITDSKHPDFATDQIVSACLPSRANFIRFLAHYSNVCE